MPDCVSPRPLNETNFFDFVFDKFLASFLHTNIRDDRICCRCRTLLSVHWTRLWLQLYTNVANVRSKRNFWTAQNHRKHGKGNRMAMTTVAMTLTVKVTTTLFCDGCRRKTFDCSQYDSLRFDGWVVSRSTRLLATFNDNDKCINGTFDTIGRQTKLFENAKFNSFGSWTNNRRP